VELRRTRDAGRMLRRPRRGNFAKDIAGAGMRSAPRRGVHQSDLPLRLTIDETGRRCFGYLIVGNDGTVALASSRLFATEAAARVAGLPVLISGVPNFRSFL
jgi:hypothetical protein